MLRVRWREPAGYFSTFFSLPQFAFVDTALLFVLQNISHILTAHCLWERLQVAFRRCLHITPLKSVDTAVLRVSRLLSQRTRLFHIAVVRSPIAFGLTSVDTAAFGLKSVDTAVFCGARCFSRRCRSVAHRLWAEIRLYSSTLWCKVVFTLC